MEFLSQALNHCSRSINVELAEKGANPREAQQETNNGIKRIFFIPEGGVVSKNGSDDPRTAVLEYCLNLIKDLSLLPDDDFCVALHTLTEKGFHAKALIGQPYEVLFREFVQEKKFPVKTFKTPKRYSSKSFISKVPAKLLPYEGLGPTYNREETLKTIYGRYEGSLKVCRVTLEKLKPHPQFQDMVNQLKASGYLNWQILSLIGDIVMNYKFDLFTHEMLRSGLPFPRERMMEIIEKRVQEEEEDNYVEIPAHLFNYDSIQPHLVGLAIKFLPAYQLKHRNHLILPEVIKELLVKRYNFFTDDVEGYEHIFDHNPALLPAKR